MKKLISVLLVCCLVLTIAGAAFAVTYPDGGATITNSSNPNNTASKTINLSASVGPYAVITFGNPSALNFVGYKNEREDGSVTYAIETNCDCWVRGIGTNFTKTYEGVTYTIPTWFRTQPADRGSVDYTYAGTVDPDVQDISYPFGQSSGVVEYYGVLGNVSSQPAGTYSAQYTIIVWNPMNVN